MARKYRNRRIGEFFKEIELSEKQGAGIPTILSELKKNGSPFTEVLIMEVIMKILMVLGLGIFELWAAIPAGLAVDLNLFLTEIASGIGSMLGAMLVIIIGDRFHNWLMKKKANPSKEKGTIYKVWDKYGVIGLGMLAPLITGALFGAAIGVSLGASSKRLILWMSLGIVFWTIILTGLGTYGIAIFESIHG